jgi:DNA-binding NtrC family response regulator
MQAPWPGNVRQLRNLIESMVVLAPRDEIRASDIPADVMDGVGSFLPMRIGQQAMTERALGGAEFEFILRSLMELRSQLEDLRRRIDGQHQDVEVIEVTNPDAPPLRVAPVAAVGPEPEEPEPEAVPIVLYRPGMTMAAIERAAIETVLKEHGGNRRKAAQVLGIGERTLYRKLKEYEIA